MAELRVRFDRNVDRTGEHHRWTGAIDPVRGNGRIKVDGRVLTAHRLAWELAYGPVPAGASVRACPDDPSCVRVEHLNCSAAAVPAASPGARRPRARKGSGSVKQVRAGVWSLAVSTRFTDGRSRRVYRTVYVATQEAAAVELARFVTEMQDQHGLLDPELRDLAFDQAIRRYLYEHLLEEKGRDQRTVDGYWKLHRQWFAPSIGAKAVRDLTRPMFDACFGAMRKAGRSRSRMNQARSLYTPFFRWAVHNGITSRNVLRDFDLPTSTHVSKETVPPEVHEVALLLSKALDVVPDIAEVLILGATTGMRRGELVGIRASSLRPASSEISVTTAVSGGRVKTTKTRKERIVAVDQETMSMLEDVLRRRHELAEVVGATIDADPFLFSLAADSSRPMDPDHVTKRVAILKGHLGIARPRAETVALEDEALRLYRGERQSRAGRNGPEPRGALSHAVIGRRLGRSERWVALAIANAERRESNGGSPSEPFDGSVLALRKFTSSELLDAGFSVSSVAGRQGHGPQVLVKHYGKRRKSADKKAAEHLGRVVHSKTHEPTSASTGDRSAMDATSPSLPG